MDWLLANPAEKMARCASYFNVTGPWLSTVIHSDLFQARLATRREAMENEQTRRITSKLADVAELGVDAMLDAMDDEEIPVSAKHSMAKTSLEALGILGKSSGGAAAPVVLQPIIMPGVSTSVLSDAKARMEKVVPATQLALAPADV